VKAQVRSSEWTVAASRCRFLLEDIVLEASACACMLVVAMVAVTVLASGCCSSALEAITALR
jgi:hypothetical protein